MPAVQQDSLLGPVPMEKVFWHFPVSLDRSRIQARSRPAGEMFSRVNTCDILCGKAI